MLRLFFTITGKLADAYEISLPKISDRDLVATMAEAVHRGKLLGRFKLYNSVTKRYISIKDLITAQSLLPRGTVKESIISIFANQPAAPSRKVKEAVGSAYDASVDALSKKKVSPGLVYGFTVPKYSNFIVAIGVGPWGRCSMFFDRASLEQLQLDNMHQSKMFMRQLDRLLHLGVMEEIDPSTMAGFRVSCSNFHALPAHIRKFVSESRFGCANFDSTDPNYVAALEAVDPRLAHFTQLASASAEKAFMQLMEVNARCGNDPIKFIEVFKLRNEARAAEVASAQRKQA